MKDFPTLVGAKRKKVDRVISFPARGFIGDSFHKGQDILFLSGCEPDSTATLFVASDS